MADALFLAVGREILSGRIQETNGRWVARRLRARGVRLVRMVVVDDLPEAVARELGRGKADGLHLLITTGGLGPTFDDRTLEGIALAIGRPLQEDPRALTLVEATYAALAARGDVAEAGLSASRRKMARLPPGAEPLPNPLGAAPGVALEWDDCLVVALPGVPREMEALFEAEVVPRIRSRWAGPPTVELRIETAERDESRLTAALEAVMREVPGTYLKSRATRFGRDVRLEVFATASGPTEAEALARVERARSRLAECLARANP